MFLLDFAIVCFLACWLLGSILVLFDRFHFLRNRRNNFFTFFVRWRLFVPSEEGISRLAFFTRDQNDRGEWSEWQEVDRINSKNSLRHMFWFPERFQEACIVRLANMVLMKIEKKSSSMEELKARKVESYLRLEEYFLKIYRERSTRSRQFKVVRELWGHQSEEPSEYLSPVVVY